MAKQWNGNSYNEDWQPVDNRGTVIGPKDWEASNANPQQPPAPQNQTPPSGGALGGAVDQQLLTQMKPPTGVNTADPAYQQQLNSGQLANARAAERSRMAAAQRMHAQGQDASGALDAAVGGIVQQQGEADQALQAMLMDKFLSADRDRAARALQLATGLQGQREGYGLQRELGMADIGLRKDAMKNQNEQFYDSLGQQLGLSTADMNQRAMLALLGA